MRAHGKKIGLGWEPLLGEGFVYVDVRGVLRDAWCLAAPGRVRRNLFPEPDFVLFA